MRQVHQELRESLRWHEWAAAASISTARPEHQVSRLKRGLLLGCNRSLWRFCCLASSRICRRLTSDYRDVGEIQLWKWWAAPQLAMQALSEAFSVSSKYPPTSGGLADPTVWDSAVWETSSTRRSPRLLASRRDYSHCPKDRNRGQTCRRYFVASQGNEETKVKSYTKNPVSMGTKAAWVSPEWPSLRQAVSASRAIHIQINP